MTADAVARCHALYEQARFSGIGPALAEVPALVSQLPPGHLRGQMCKLHGVYAMRQRDFSTAITSHEMALQDLADDLQVLDNLLVSLLQLKNYDDVLHRGRHGLAQHPDAFCLHDAVAEALCGLGRIDEARGHGTLSLTLKDRQSTRPAHDLSAVRLPAFADHAVTRNVISFTLYGAAERYCRGAIENAVGRDYIYPGWTCRFYVDASVPADVVRQLTAAGAQIVAVDALPATPFGVFWRYLVADDPGVDRFLVRDADSVINVRERVAVDEWLASGKHFHVMRDHVQHSELVLAGMWGGVGGALPRMLPAIQAFAADQHRMAGRTADQVFLREILWPTIRQSVFIHDSQFSFGARRDFPDVGGLPRGRTIGDYVLRSP